MLGKVVCYIHVLISVLLEEAIFDVYQYIMVLVSSSFRGSSSGLADSWGIFLPQATLLSLYNFREEVANYCIQQKARFSYFPLHHFWENFRKIFPILVSVPQHELVLRYI